MEGVALILWNLVATPFIGRKRLRWSTVETEAIDPLPGDGLVPQPKWSHTLGITIDASPDDVWPWIAQLGQGRGGFYTYQTLENMVGCRITNTTEILPEHQHPVVGEGIHLYADASLPHDHERRPAFNRPDPDSQLDIHTADPSRRPLDSWITAPTRSE